jgi:cytochrome c oxidase assembly protein subunit 15
MIDPLPLLAKIALILTIILVSLSSYLRLDHSGIGCEPWPACYGNIGVVTESPGVANTYERLLEEANQPLSWATPLHRLVASVLGVLILVMNMFALQKKSQRIFSLGLLALTVFLAWLGIYSQGLHIPAVVMGNLCGGFALLGMLGWMVLRKPNGETKTISSVRRWALLAIVALCVQIFLGGLTSANFAASACQTVPDCHGSWLPGAEIVTAFDLSRTLEVGDTGMVLGGAERAAIHKLHRLIAVLTVISMLIAGTVAYKEGRGVRVVGFVVITLVTFEFLLGVSAIMTGLPIGVAVAHNWLAAILLLALLKLFADASVGSTSALDC